MSMGATASRVGVSEDTVRRWIDANEPDDEHPDRVPVALRERDKQGRAVPNSWRRPYVDAVEEWARRRSGTGPSPSAAVSGEGDR